MKLKEARVEIDKIDKAIRELFIQRMAVAEEIVRYKAESGDAIYKPEREKEIIENLSAEVDASIRDEYITFLKAVLDASKHYQYRRLAELKGDE